MKTELFYQVEFEYLHSGTGITYFSADTKIFSNQIDCINYAMEKVSKAHQTFGGGKIAGYNVRMLVAHYNEEETK